MLLLVLVLWVGSAMGANAVESLFFVRFGPEFLPYLYIATGVLSFAALAAVNALMDRWDPGRFTVLALGAMAGVIVATRLLIAIPGRWIYPVSWLAMMLIWTLSLFGVWTLAGSVHDTRQAKRLFPLYGSGLIVGAVVGGLATGPLASLMGTENLLLVWAAALAGASILAASIRRMSGPVRPSRGRRQAAPLRAGLRVVRGSSLLRWMAVSLALFALLYFSLAVVFARAATARFPAADRLAGFLGLFMGASSGAALLLSLFAANRLFARIGVAASVLVLPLIYLVGFAVLVVQPAFVALVVFRFVQMAWVNGVWATGWQALFNVVPPEQRARVRTLMDGVPLQLGMIASGVLLILAERVLRPRDVAVIGLVSAAVATLAMWRARRAYAGALADALRAGNPEVFMVEEEPFGGFRGDARAMDIATRGTNDPDPAVRRISMEIVAESSPSDASSALVRGLDDDDPVVRAAALRGLARSGDHAACPRVAALLEERDAQVRSGAVEAVRACCGDRAPAALRPLLADPDPAVRARAAVGLLEADGGSAAEEVLRAMAGAPRAEWRGEAIGALGRVGLGFELVASGLDDPEPAVRAAAVEALGSFPPERSLEHLIHALGDAETGVRDRAVTAIARVGPGAAEQLARAVNDPRLEAGAIAALGELPGADPDVLHRYARDQVRRALRYAELLAALPGRDGRLGPLAHALRHRSLEHAGAALRAVSGMGDPATMRLAIENLGSEDPGQRANALEALESVGEQDIVRPLLDLWEWRPARTPGGAHALRELLRDPDPWVRACATHAAAESDDAEIRETLAELARSDADTLVREIAARAAEGATVVESLPSLSLMERVVFLRRVPLFAELSPADLKHVAEVVSEHVYPEGEVIAEQGEPGEELYIVVEGEIGVMVARDGGHPVEVARRSEGDYVGEMSVISRQPRMASLVCTRSVRTLAIDRRRLERILRERPDASLAMMRVLSSRLRESHGVGGTA